MPVFIQSKPPVKSNQHPSVNKPTTAQATIPAGAPDAMVVNTGSEIVLIQALGRKGDAS